MRGFLYAITTSLIDGFNSLTIAIKRNRAVLLSLEQMTKAYKKMFYRETCQHPELCPSGEWQFAAIGA